MRRLLFAIIAALAVVFGLPHELRAQAVMGCGATQAGTEQYTWLQPPTFKPMCGRSFSFQYSCPAASGGGFGQPVGGVPTVVFTPDPYAVDWQMHPFENQEIKLVGAAWSYLTPGSTPITYLTFGNNPRPDLMGHWDSTSIRKDFFFKTGYGVQWPKASEATAQDYLDVHGACAEGGGGTILLTLYYEPLESYNPNPPPGTAWNKLLLLGDNAGGMTHIQVISKDDITASGSQVRVTVRASGDPGLSLSSLAICKRSGATENCDGSWIELLFGGSAGLSLTSGWEATSDFVTLGFSNASDYLVKLVHGATSGVRYQASGAGVYYRIGTAPYQFSADKTYGVTRIEAVTP